MPQATTATDLISLSSERWAHVCLSGESCHLFYSYRRRELARKPSQGAGMSRDSANAAVWTPHLFARFQSLTPIDSSGGNGVLLAHLFQPVLFNTIMISVHCAWQNTMLLHPSTSVLLCSKRERRMWSFLPVITFSLAYPSGHGPVHHNY